MEDTMDKCRACRSGNMFFWLKLGLHPPANQFLREEQLTKPEVAFPLNAYVCLDCALIQVPNNIPENFFRNYIYVPSASDTMHTHFSNLASKLVSQYLPSKKSLIVDIGCNDGLFLIFCKEQRARVLGIDPAENITEVAQQKGIEVVNEYFSTETAKKIEEQFTKAKIIVTTNTFNHIDNLYDFMGGITILLDPKGIFVVEIPHSLELVEKNEFDTIYHEHVSEFSIKSIVDLYSYFDMEVFDIDKLPIHGGSMRLYGQKKGGSYEVNSVVQEWLSKEEEAKLFSQSTYEASKDRVYMIKDKLLNLLKRLKREGKKLAGYGAPAKGNTLLNYFKIGTDLLDFLVDKNPLKQGLYSPGMHIPIVPPEKILEDCPDYLLLLAWNFSDEIIQQQKEYRKRGGKFILPIPEPKIID